MKILQLLLGICGLFVGAVHIFEMFDMYVSFDMNPYYMILFGLSVVSVFMMPYEWASKNLGIIKMKHAKIEHTLIHQLIQEEMRQDETVELVETEVEEKKDALWITPQIKVNNVSDLSIEEKTNELTEQLSQKMKQVFGEGREYRFQLLYRSK